MPVPRDDSARWRALQSAVDAADVPPPEAAELYRATAACVHLGAVDFISESGEAEGSGAVAPGVSEACLSTAAALLGCDADALRRALCVRQIKAGSDWVEKPNTPDVCAELCDGEFSTPNPRPQTTER